MDPNGIDREEMTRLATERLMVEHFDKSKLSKDGALILVNETDVTLPDGSIVDNGLTFRNNFHMSKFAKADLFVPCGGRPESINAGNVKELFDENEWKKFNEPNFEYADCSTCSKNLGLDTYKNTNGFFTEYSMTIPSEDMAEVYSHLITGNYEISNDKILNKKIKFIKDKLKKIDNTFAF